MNKSQYNFILLNYNNLYEIIIYSFVIEVIEMHINVVNKAFLNVKNIN